MLCSPASADVGYGLYIGAGAGASFARDQRIASVGFPFLGVKSVGSQESNLRLDTGFVGLASVGYRLGNGLRLELEGDYRSNRFSGAAYDGNGRGSGAGNG